MVSPVHLQMNPNSEDYSDPSDSSACPSPTTSYSEYGSEITEEEYPQNTVEDKSPNEPKLTYATLIAQAIMSTAEQKTLLQDIYSYITTNYEYYRTCNKQWQNSIRHNLSLHKAFCKLPRQKGTPGKGNFWTLTDEYRKFFIDGELHIPKGYELDKEGAKAKNKGKITKAIVRSQAAPYYKPSEQSVFSSSLTRTNDSSHRTIPSTNPNPYSDLPPTPDSAPDMLSYRPEDPLHSACLKTSGLTGYVEIGAISQPVFPELNLNNMDIYQLLYSNSLASLPYQGTLYSSYPELKSHLSDMTVAPELLMGPNTGYAQPTELFEVESFLNFE
ncbi:hypothetical protein K493DRAFT_4063 [Basidiobolus meristosporus CBS 931.73]|uniref:Fork-head domain-containing protein n=1 Tax=Basidiobolus meristosporus CBS 931.73 TaxID=1314790 RepID=A0A1Y1YLW8_9FUNG|nr:hypothetical protein K493DRAFT_4063 [Basidiobolus meristosporus CBS 931.73]|eukprot:ORX98833.1 hypothetical protein K493DRAFT_4063 [Basidiobolus meristosporus CBS 931.73]